MKRGYFITLVGLQVIFLLLMTVSFYAMDSFGDTIKLKSEPVDPRDPFYGDYVTLSYEVEQISDEKWTGEENVHPGEKINVLLEPNKNGIYEVKQASPDSITASSKDQVVLDAKYEGHDNFLETHHVSLGLSRYYIQENDGAQFGNATNEKLVEIVVSPWGQKKIISVK